MSAAVSALSTAEAPLAGTRVLNLGGIWAGRLASMLLADQGAEVIDISNPAESIPAERAMLSRGKHDLALDLVSAGGQQQARALAKDADIVFDNLGGDRSARFGLDYVSVRALNPAVVYVSMPAKATGAAPDDVGGWEGSIAASVGVYTDIHGLGPFLGGKPIFSALPMASAYGGVHAAIAASAAYFHRIRTGEGGHVEVPLRDALLSAMALLIMKIENQPSYFDLPTVDKGLSEVAMPILRDFADRLSPEHLAVLRSHVVQHTQPFFMHHKCGDGRFIFLNAMGHVHQARACLEAMGLLDDLIAEGLVVASPYDTETVGRNVNEAGSLTIAWKQRILKLLSERLKTASARQWESRLQAARVPVTVVRTAHEWLSFGVAHQAGLVASLHDPDFGETQQSGRFISISGKTVQSPPLRSRATSDGKWSDTAKPILPAPGEGGRKVLEGIRVLDLSNVIAGPLAGRVLAEFGAEVIRVDPLHPQAGPRMTMWFGLDVNQGKRAIILDLKSKKGRAALERLIRQSDVVLHNFLDRSVEGIGISEGQLRAINPDAITCQISAWAGSEGGPFKDFPAYDPVLQAATGITSRYGTPDAPVLHGLASCVDYITGFSAALGILNSLSARALNRGASYVRTSLAMGAQLVQFPFMVRIGNRADMMVPSGQGTMGYGAHYRLYRASDQWLLFNCRPQDIKTCAAALGAADSSEAAMTSAIQALSVTEVNRRISGIGTASATQVMRLDSLRDKITIPEFSQERLSLEGRSLLIVDAAHPSGHRISLPFPSWYRSELVKPDRLSPAPKPGTHTDEVLQEIGFSKAEVQDLVNDSAAGRGWSIMPGYFPAVPH